MTGGFPEDHTMSVYEQCAYNEYIQEVMADSPPEDLAPMTELGDTYVNTELMLTRGSTLPKVVVTGSKHDAGGQVCVWDNNNPILNTRT